MPQNQPQTIVNDLIKSLSHFNNYDNKISEFDFHGFLREAKKIPRPQESLMVLGMIYSLNNDYEKSKEYFEKAISLAPPKSLEVIIVNYSATRHRMQKNIEAFALLKRYDKEINSQVFLKIIARSAYNIGLFNQAIHYSSKLKTLDDEDKEVLEYSREVLRLCKELDIDENDVHKLYLLVLETAAKHHKKITSFSLFAEDDSLSIIYRIDADAATLSKIGFDVIDRLVESDVPAISDYKLTPLIFNGSP